MQKTNLNLRRFVTNALRGSDRETIELAGKNQTIKKL